MSRFRRFELIEEPIYCSPPVFVKETSFFVPKTLTFPSILEEDLDAGFALDLFNPCPLASPFEVFDSVGDLVRIDRTPSFSHKRVQRVERLLGTDLYLKSLSDRVSDLESRFDRLVGAKSGSTGDRKYTWTAEIKGPEREGFDRKYKWIAEIKEEEKKKKGATAKNLKWTAEIKGKGEDSGTSRKYTFQVESGSGKKTEKENEKSKKDKKDKKKGSELRIVEIEEPRGQGAVVLRQVKTA